MDALKYVKRYEQCQHTKPLVAMDEMPLRPIMATRAFARWGIDFVGPIKPPARHTHADQGLPIEIVSDQGVHFINEVIEFLLAKFMVLHRRSTAYHPQAKGQVESTNKILCTALTKVVSESCLLWEIKLALVLWAYRTGTTPFQLVYDQNAILPIEFLVPTLRVAKELEWNGQGLSERVDKLEKLDETRLLAIADMYAEKHRCKDWHNQKIKTKRFQEGNLVLLYTLKKHKQKLKKRGLGPFVVSELTLSRAVRLETLDGA